MTTETEECECNYIEVSVSSSQINLLQLIKYNVRNILINPDGAILELVHQL